MNLPPTLASEPFYVAACPTKQEWARVSSHPSDNISPLLLTVTVDERDRAALVISISVIFCRKHNIASVFSIDPNDVSQRIVQTRGGKVVDGQVGGKSLLTRCQRLLIFI